MKKCTYFWRRHCLCRIFLVNMNFDAITSNFMFTQKKRQNFLAFCLRPQLFLCNHIIFRSPCRYCICFGWPTTISSSHKIHNDVKSLALAYPIFNEHLDLVFELKRHKFSLWIPYKIPLEIQNFLLYMPLLKTSYVNI